MSEVTIETKVKLNLNQEAFAQLYASDEEFFANGVQSYIEVYQPDQSRPNWYKSACVSASQLLSNIKVSNRINEILELRGLNDSFVDKQLEFLITQHADFGVKVKAITEYNKLKSRITQRTDLTNSDGTLAKTRELSDEELYARLNSLNQRHSAS